jgi:UDP:flavonoid glycosyltransferase YjiC (YdhE family)
MEESRKPTVLVYTVGSRGDVQPYLAFAKCLLERNVHVVFATHAPFEAFVREKLSP